MNLCSGRSGASSFAAGGDRGNLSPKGNVGENAEIRESAGGKKTLFFEGEKSTRDPASKSLKSITMATPAAMNALKQLTTKQSVLQVKAPPPPPSLFPDRNLSRPTLLFRPFNCPFFFYFLC